MTSGGFEPTVPASERPQTDNLNRAATGVVLIIIIIIIIIIILGTSHIIREVLQCEA
jgi:hypothetical protein